MDSDDGQRRSRRRLLNILCHAFWKRQEKSLIALEPWPDSLFADMVVITDTALTPAPCPCLKAWSHHGARTAACLYRKRKLHRTRGPPTHATETTVVRANTTKRSRSKRIRHCVARIMGATWCVVSHTKLDTAPALSELRPCRRFCYCARHQLAENRVILRT